MPFGVGGETLAWPVQDLDKLVEKFLFAHKLHLYYGVRILFLPDHSIHFIDPNSCTFERILSRADAKAGPS